MPLPIANCLLQNCPFLPCAFLYIPLDLSHPFNLFKIVDSFVEKRGFGGDSKLRKIVNKKKNGVNYLTY